MTGTLMDRRLTSLSTDPAIFTNFPNSPAGEKVNCFKGRQFDGPLHYRLRGSMGFEKYKKVGKTRPLFLIQ